jgi:lipid II:glycine glycyltransferase (peptidoglycan interpeptide bridge formation enzyme)
MPLTHKKKFGIKFLAQPLFTQQLGVFSTRSITNEIVKSFIDAIPTYFRYIVINLNKYNQLSPLPTNHKINHNFELDLIFSHEKLFHKYSENTQRNIAKAKQGGLSVKSNTCSVNDFINLVKNNVKLKKENLPQEKYNDISKIINFSLQGHFGEIISVYSKENKLLAAVFFIFSHKKAIYLFAASTEEGKKSRAMFLLIDEFIIKYSEKNLILDFEGSNIEGLARFYHGFGATDCEYITIRQNRLPFPLKFLKK